MGVVSEGDLMRRAEIGTEPQRSWWLELFAGERAKAEEFVRAHAVKVADVMTTKVVTATEDTPLSTIAALLERHRIKRVPILRDGSVVGIVSRANLLQAFAGTPPAEDARTASDDQALRERVVAQIRSQPWGMPWLMTVTVRDGVVELWGPVNSEEQKRTIRVAAEATPGVRRVEDNLLSLAFGRGRHRPARTSFIRPYRPVPPGSRGARDSRGPPAHPRGCSEARASPGLPAARPTAASGSAVEAGPEAQAPAVVFGSDMAIPSSMKDRAIIPPIAGPS